MVSINVVAVAFVLQIATLKRAIHAVAKLEHAADIASKVRDRHRAIPSLVYLQHFTNQIILFYCK